MLRYLGLDYPIANLVSRVMILVEIRESRNSLRKRDKRVSGER